MRRKKTARKKSLKGKLLVWFLIFALAPLGALAYFSSQSFMETLTERQIEEYHTASQLMGKNLADFMANAAVAVGVLAKDRDLVAEDVSSEVKLQKLKELLAQNTVFFSASLIDSEGKILVDTEKKGIGDTVKDRDWYQEVVERKGVVITNLRQSQRFGTLTINIAAPVYNELGMFSGVLVLYLDLSNLYKELTKGVDFGRGYLYVYDSTHENIVIHPDPSLIGKTFDEIGLSHIKGDLQKKRRLRPLYFPRNGCHSYLHHCSRKRSFLWRKLQKLESGGQS